MCSRPADAWAITTSMNRIPTANQILSMARAKPIHLRQSLDGNNSAMTGGQKLLFAIGVVLIIVAVVLAVQTRPKPEQSFCAANQYPSTWGYDPDDGTRFAMNVLPASSADRNCDITFTWPGNKITNGYVGQDGSLYMTYRPGGPSRKHRIINNSRIAELADDGSIANYKVKL